MAELYKSASFGVEEDDSGPDDLPGLGALSPGQLTELGFDQLDAALLFLGGALKAAGVKEITTADGRELLRKAQSVEALRDAIKDLHVELMVGLTAADFRLGKAYRLGRSLADTCQLPDDQDSFEYAFGPRVNDLKDSLADLASALPAHAGQAVAISLATWERWAAQPMLEGRDLDWDTDWPRVRAPLHRQGELWRALLSDEKRGSDMLKTVAYVAAAEGMLARAGGLAWRFLKRFAIPAVGVVLLLALGIVALVLGHSTVLKIAGSISAAAGALGITLKGTTVTLGAVTTDIESRLWGAELDRAIAIEITTGPQGWGADPAAVADALPATGETPPVADDLTVLRDFRRAVRENRLTAGGLFRLGRSPVASDFLHPYVKFILGHEISAPTTVDGRDAVLRWLAQDQRPRDIVGAEPIAVADAGGGRFATAQQPADGVTGQRTSDTGRVWTVRYGLIVRWQYLYTYDQARQTAGLPKRQAESEGGGTAGLESSV